MLTRLRVRATISLPLLYQGPPVHSIHNNCFSFNTQLEILLGISPGGNYDIALNLTMFGLNSPVSDLVNIGFHQANASIALVLVHPEQLVGYVRSGSGYNFGEAIVMNTVDWRTLI